jgi:hypothetical protein
VVPGHDEDVWAEIDNLWNHPIYCFNGLPLSFKIAVLSKEVGGLNVEIEEIKGLKILGQDLCLLLKV